MSLRSRAATVAISGVIACPTIEIAKSACGLLAMTTFVIFMPFMFFMVKTASPKLTKTNVIPEKAKPRSGIHPE
jgi:hypothetical protein